MDNFLAVYLALGIGLVLVIAGFYFKKNVLFILATLAWFMVTFYCLAEYATNGELYVLGLGVFGFAAAVVCALTPYYFLAEKNAEKPRKTDIEQMQDDYADYHDQVNAHRGLGKKLRNK